MKYFRVKIINFQIVSVLGLYSGFASRAVKRKRLFFDGVGVGFRLPFAEFLAFPVAVPLHTQPRLNHYPLPARPPPFHVRHPPRSAPPRLRPRSPVKIVSLKTLKGLT